MMSSWELGGFLETGGGMSLVTDTSSFLKMLKDVSSAKNHNMHNPIELEETERAPY